MRSRSVVLAFIHPGQCSAFFTVSLAATIRADAIGPRRIEDVLQTYSSANVSEARNLLVDRFLDECRADWLWFVDADMQWAPDALDTLLEVADPQRAPVVGGLCFGLADDELFPTLYDAAQNEHGDLVFVRRGDYPDNAMVQVSATGAAFLLVHRSVLLAIRETIGDKAFPYFRETTTGGDRPRIVGEDLTFCVRAAQCGFPTHVHTGVEVGHHKSQLLTASVFAAQRSRREQESAPIGRIASDGVRHGEPAEGLLPGPAQRATPAPSGPASPHVANPSPHA